MDAGVYGRSYLNLPTESLSDTVTGLTPDPREILSRSPPHEDGSEGQRINGWPLDIPLNTHNPQVNEEARLSTSCWTHSLYQPASASVQPYLTSLRPSESVQPTLVQGMGELVGTQTPRPGGLINSVHEEDLPALRLLGPTGMRCATAFPWFTEPAYSPSTPPIGLVNMDPTRDYQEDMTMYIPSMQSRRYTRTDPTTDFVVPSIAPGRPRMPTVGLCEEQIASQDQYQEPQRTADGRRHGVIPSRSLPLRRPAGIMIRRAPMGRYSCNLCGKRYTQPQGIKRHQRETHEASLCMYCRDFKWGRPYLLRGHLKKRHPDVNIDTALEEATRTRRRATGIESYRGD